MFQFSEMIEITGWKQKLGMLKNMQSESEIFTSSSVAYLTVNFEKVVSDLSYAGSTLVESECFKRKRRQCNRNSPET